MKRHQVLISTLAAGLLLSCQPAAPDIDHAIALYNQGRLNEARAEFTRYLKARQFDDRSNEATQHILLIRRIKRLENIVLTHWQNGNLEGARQVVSVMRYMHPVYLDSSKVLAGINLQPTPGTRDKDWLPPALKDDPVLKQLVPYLLAVLDRHEGMVIHLARQWEAIKYDREEQLVGAFAIALSSPETVSLLTAMDNAYLELLNINGQSNPMIEELGRIAAQFDQLLLSLSNGNRLGKTVFEYRFHIFKRQLLMKILDIKSRLGASKA